MKKLLDKIKALPEFSVHTEGDERFTWSSEQEAGQLLTALMATISAKKVLEIGVLRGFTSAQMIAALPEDGEYTGIDIEDQVSDAMKAIIASLKRNATFITEDSVRAMPTLPERHFDLIFIDGLHDYGHVIQELKIAERLIKPDGIIAFHDVRHPGCPGVTKVVNYLRNFPRVYDVLDLPTPLGPGIAICRYKHGLK